MTRLHTRVQLVLLLLVLASAVREGLWITDVDDPLTALTLKTQFRLLPDNILSQKLYL